MTNSTGKAFARKTSTSRAPGAYKIKVVHKSRGLIAADCIHPFTAQLGPALAISPATGQASLFVLFLICLLFRRSNCAHPSLTSCTTPNALHTSLMGNGLTFLALCLGVGVTRELFLPSIFQRALLAPHSEHLFGRSCASEANRYYPARSSPRGSRSTSYRFSSRARILPFPKVDRWLPRERARSGTTACLLQRIRRRVSSAALHSSSECRWILRRGRFPSCISQARAVSFVTRSQVSWTSRGLTPCV